jgi:hypothetical protein
VNAKSDSKLLLDHYCDIASATLAEGPRRAALV